MCLDLYSLWMKFCYLRYFLHGDKKWHSISGIKNGGSHKSYLSTATNLALLRPKALNNWNFYKSEPQQMSGLHTIDRQSKPLVPFTNIGNRNSKCLDYFRRCYKGQLISDHISLQPLNNENLSITLSFFLHSGQYLTDLFPINDSGAISWSNNFWKKLHCLFGNWCSVNH